MGSAGSPETMNVIVNSTDFALGLKATEVDTTNFGNNFTKTKTTVKTLGPLTFKVFWIPEEPTHRNSAGGGSVANGLRYALINNVLMDFQIGYPGGPTDAFAGLVADFSITGKTKGVFEANLSIVPNDDSPSLV
jgi:hypothetical protein